ncbi:MAG: laccase domain-containing protein [Candidatus Moranbacteria bacterium]|nr:laccase domain-containing protein [Candidatus Moranbacteria bacterium]
MATERRGVETTPNRFPRNHNADGGALMPKRVYTKKNTAYDLVLPERYLDDSRDVEVFISTVADDNMDPRFSDDALRNYQSFLEKHCISSADAFSPALGQNYRIITIDEWNEEKYAGKFVEYGDPREEYRCDAVIVSGTNIPVAFRVGDCPTVLIVGEAPQDIRVMALVHAGRAELRAEVLKTTVARMISGFRMHFLSATAYVFPHICRHCYALQYLGPDVSDQEKNFLETIGGIHHLDMLGWLEYQLLEAGIRRVSKAHFRCTAGISENCASALLHKSKNFKGLFSHYRSFHRKSAEGRFIVLVRIIDRELEEDE